MSNPLDPAALKRREHETWTHGARVWRKNDAILMRGTAPASQRMLDVAGIRPGSRVLDIACGTGEPALPAAERVGSQGRVLATDFVDEMLAFAREKAAARGLSNIEFRKTDGEDLDVPAESFDAVTIRWGLMFMPDPQACLRRALAALRPGGRIAVACWAGPERNPFFTVSIGVLRRHMEVPVPPPGAPHIFVFADGQKLTATLEEAGFRNVTLEALTLTMAEFKTGEEYWAYVREMAGPVANLFAKLPDEQQGAASAEISQEAEKFREGDTLAMTGVTWIAGGVK